MNEDAIREMIRRSIARHIGAPAEAPGDRAVTPAPPPLIGHASHFRYALPDSGGPCLIEPTVACNHCGYCQSHGH
ncbi:MAG TPA: hypothetical protein VNJ03_17980 [Vicinamibacterales bacterium]|nr:hypothetical protein [Vicinamibacterales bacterium]